MTIIEAFAQIMASPSFKEAVGVNDKKGNQYKALKSKFIRGTLKESALLDVLQEFGYTITVKK